jgi:hypothetical protein
MVDFPYVMAQLGEDAFKGHGWEIFDRGEASPPDQRVNYGSLGKRNES